MTSTQLQRARIATFTFFTLNGFVLGLWVVNIPEIKDRTGTSTEELGYLILLFGGAALVGMQVVGRLIDRFGSGAVTVGACVALCALLVGPGLATTRWQLGLALIVLGLANGCVDVGQNSHASVVEQGYGRPIMSAFHAWFSLGGLVASIVGGVLIEHHVDLRWTLGLSGAVGIVVIVLVRSLVLQHAVPETSHAEDGDEPRGRAPWSSKVVLIAALAFALFLSEGVAYDWSTVHLHDSLGADKATAAWAFGAFSTAMTIVRLLADRVVGRIGPAAYVQVAALIGAAALAGAALSPEPWVAIVAWAVFGIGLAGCIPQFFSAAGRIDPANAGLYMARVTSAGYVGMLAGPAIIGILTRWMPLTVAFSVPIAGCLLAGLLSRQALAPEDETCPHR